MKRLAVVVTVVALTAAAAASSPPAEPSPCPDQFQLFPVMDEQDQKTDKNNNGLVCRKVGGDGKVRGGPDDRTDDLVI